MNQPVNLDLISFVENDALMLMACTKDWFSTSEPNSGAIGRLAEQVVKRFPEAFTDAEQCMMQLMLVHARNMRFGENSAGQEYPAHHAVKIGKPERPPSAMQMNLDELASIGLTPADFE